MTKKQIFLFFLLLITVALSSCKKEVEPIWLWPIDTFGLTQKKLLNSGYVRIPIDVPYYEKSSADSSMSFQFLDFKSDTCLYQIWELKNRFKSQKQLNRYLADYDLRKVHLCQEDSSFFVQHWHANSIYHVILHDDGAVRFTYEFPFHKGRVGE